MYFDDNSKLCYEINRKDPYESIASHCTRKTEVKILDHIDLNPCFYDSVGQVFKTLSNESQRLRNIIGRDGLPHMLSSHLIERHHTCTLCLLNLKRFQDCEAHLTTTHVNSNIRAVDC